MHVRRARRGGRRHERGEMREPWVDEGGSGPSRAFFRGEVESPADITGKGYAILYEAAEGEGSEGDGAALLLTLSLR